MEWFCKKKKIGGGFSQKGQEGRVKRIRCVGGGEGADRVLEAGQYKSNCIIAF